MRDMYQISAKLANPAPKRPKHNFPWNDLIVGKCFLVKHDEMKLKTLRALASNMSRKLNRKFRVAVHDDVYEVGRLE